MLSGSSVSQQSSKMPRFRFRFLDIAINCRPSYYVRPKLQRNSRAGVPRPHSKVDMHTDKPKLYQPCPSPPLSQAIYSIVLPPYLLVAALRWPSISYIFPIRPRASRDLHDVSSIITMYKHIKELPRKDDNQFKAEEFSEKRLRGRWISKRQQVRLNLPQPSTRKLHLSMMEQLSTQSTASQNADSQVATYN